jgi:hypothetical protein
MAEAPIGGAGGASQSRKSGGKFAPTKKKNPCRICGNTKGDCRETDGEMLLCMKGGELLGYKAIGHTKCGTWEQYVPEDREAPDREAKRIERQRKADERQKARLERSKSKIPDSERHDHYRRMLAGLSLRPEDRVDLAKRGFSDEQIEAIGFKSVWEGQILTKEFPENLPGICPGGKSLNVGAPGYLCPIRDTEGRIVGCQLRVRDAQENKYRWLSSANLQNAAEANLQNGELPLSHFGIDLPGSHVGLVEGTGPKPALVSIRAGIPVIGAAGGLWGSSPKTLKASLDKFEAQHKTNQVVLYADAGAIANPNVMRQYQKVAELVQSWGFEFRVAWWGQAKKGHNQDPDEVLEEVLQSAALLTWNEFAASGEPQIEANREAEPETQAESETPEPSLTPEEEKPGFSSTLESGLVYREWQKDKRTGELEIVEIYVGGHIEAIAYVDSPIKDDAGIRLQFATGWKTLTELTMSRGLLGGDGNAVKTGLLSRGYIFRRERSELLLRYLGEVGFNVENKYTIADQSGWVDGSYVLQTQTVGDQSIHFQDIGGPRNPTIEVRGTLESWWSNVGARCIGNSRLIGAVGAGLAGPLLAPLNQENGAIHLVGGTSIGKTTAVEIAMSVTGDRTRTTWNQTPNGLEALAASQNHSLVTFDELNEGEPQAVKANTYTFVNGCGRGRMTKTLKAAKRNSWQAFGLSTGEVSMSQYFAQAKLPPLKGGQDNRFPSVPADAGKGFGLFDTIHNFPSAREFADELKQRSREHRGTALPAFLECLVPAVSRPEWIEWASQRLRAITRELMAGLSDGDGAIGRVAKRFALIQLDLELAQQWSVTRFPEGQVSWAIATLFKDWLADRGGSGAIEVKQALEKLEGLFATCEHGTDRILNLSQIDPTPPRDLLAYYRSPEDQFWVVPQALRRFAHENGVQPSDLVAEMQKRQWMAGAGTDGKNLHTKRISPSRTARIYIVYPFWREGVTTQPPLGTGTPGTETTVAPAGVTAEPVPETLASRGIQPVTPQIEGLQKGVTGESLSHQGSQPPCYTVTLLHPEKECIGEDECLQPCPTQADLPPRFFTAKGTWSADAHVDVTDDNWG